MVRAAKLPRAFPRIERAILVIRGQRVMLDADLAELYGAETRALIQAVTRNATRFPADFMFRLSTVEHRRLLRSQFVISSSHGGRRTRPYACTEQGVAMAASVLRSGRAAQVNIAIVRTFVRLREMLVQHAGLARRIDELDARYDGRFAEVFEAIRALVEPPAGPEAPRRRIGFHRDPDPGRRACGRSGDPNAARQRRRVTCRHDPQPPVRTGTASPRARGRRRARPA